MAGLQEKLGGDEMGTMSKNWGDLPTNGDRQARAREVDLHVSLTDDERYIQQHEALKRMATLTVETIDDVVDHMHKQALRDGMDSEDEIRAVYSEEREYHVRKIASILVNAALDSWMKRRLQPR
jgi:hypothetical protein